MKTHILNWLLIPTLLLTFIGSGQAAPPPPTASTFDTIQLPASAFALSVDGLPNVDKDTNGKLDSTMRSLAQTALLSAQAATDLAAAHELRTLDGRIHAQILIEAAHLQSILQAVSDAGSEVTGIANGDTLLQGWLPPQALEKLTEVEGVQYIRRPAELVLFEENLAVNATTEGLAAINGPAWHAAGYRGAGIKVAIVDAGFIGYSTLLGSDLPASVTVKNFVDGETDGQVGTTTEHGTACAEIVYDIAPQATIYLVKVGTNVDLAEAVTYLIGQGVKIISTSLGWYNLTPGDGTGEFANLVQTARNNGILWATAASNDRESHWGGLYADSDGDKWHEFSGKEINCFGPDSSSCYNIPAGYAIRAFLRWNNWTAPVNQDYDLYIVRWNGSGWSLVGGGEDVQNGGAGQSPTEYAYAVTSGGSTAYGVVIYRYNATQVVNFELFAPKFARMSELFHARSLANLADAPAAMTVAALDSTAPYPQESYSSEGPTNGPGGSANGGAIKPDIAGFANVSTSSYGYKGFNGTSAATPHVAGAAAVAWSAYPSYTPAQVRSFLESRAIDMGSTGKDTLYGYGRLNLGSLPYPVINSITPSSAANTGTVNITNLAGSYFQSGATVKITKSGQADRAATNVVVISSSQITCQFNLSGATAGPWNLVVTNPDGQNSILLRGFTVTDPLVPPPVVTGIDPTHAKNNASVHITRVSGSNFKASTTFRLTRSGQPDILATNIVVSSSTWLVGDLNLVGQYGGLWNVVAVNPDTQEGQLSNGFEIEWFAQVYLPIAAKSY